MNRLGSVGCHVSHPSLVVPEYFGRTYPCPFGRDCNPLGQTSLYNRARDCRIDCGLVRRILDA